MLFYLLMYVSYMHDLREYESIQNASELSLHPGMCNFKLYVTKATLSKRVDDYQGH